MFLAWLRVLVLCGFANVLYLVLWISGGFFGFGGLLLLTKVCLVCCVSMLWFISVFFTYCWIVGVDAVIVL